jgi:hypothetical protein
MASLVSSLPVWTGDPAHRIGNAMPATDLTRAGRSPQRIGLPAPDGTATSSLGEGDPHG